MYGSGVQGDDGCNEAEPQNGHHLFCILVLEHCPAGASLHCHRAGLPKRHPHSRYALMSTSAWAQSGVCMDCCYRAAIQAASGDKALA